MERIFQGAMLFALIGCGAQQSGSELSVRYGQVIPESDYPSVVFLGGCTGTFVSPTTLITAKHCVGSPNSQGIVSQQIRLPRQGNVYSLKVFAHPSGPTCCSKHDVAVAIFPKNTALQVTELSFAGVVQKDEITMVGFGGKSGDPTAGDFGIKRIGTNAVDSVSEGMIKTTMNPNGQSRCGLAPGDSGGPLFKNGAFVGVASSGDGRTWSRHVDISNPEAIRVLKIAVDHGAEIPGLSE